MISDSVTSRWRFRADSHSKAVTNGRPTKVTSSRRSSEQAHPLLEFAVVLPVLLSLLLGIVTSGFALNSSNSINNAAR